MRHIEGMDRNQITFLPTSIDEYVGEDNPIRVLDAFIESLDLKKLGFRNAECKETGRPPYRPQDILKLLFYGMPNRIKSSRRLETEAYRNIEVIWLLKDLKPDFKTIADFRKDNAKGIKAVFKEFTKLSLELGLYGKELVAIDGSKFRACNSKKNNYNDQKLQRHLKYIEDRIDEYLKELDENDAAEANDRKFTKEEIQKKIKELEGRKIKYEELQEKLEEAGESEVSTTDPDSRLMGNNKNVEVGYNVQTTVDSKHKLILDFKVTNNPNDLGELDNMALRAKKLFKDAEFEVLADKGYYRADDLKKCIKKGITPYVATQTRSNSTGDRDFYSDKFQYDKDKNVYICPANKELFQGRVRKEREKIIGYDYRNYDACSNCEFRKCCTKSKKGRAIFRHIDQDFLDTINYRTEANRDKYRLRQCIVEHPFGTVKRGWGAYYFLTKDKATVVAEMAMAFLAYNMKRAISVLGIQKLLEILNQKREAVLV
ncbi:MAG: IS1182 family transposase [Ignavibacteria bacterium]|jgi:transposase|nr:IS1182 family transposase [Ignavibacteria bacterium]MCU7526775.1 IS1182 family transposase [Ignavibacteria bacterium]